MQETGKSDATGGYHGDERIDLEPGDGYILLIDGLPVSLSDISESEFIGCDKFEYITYSHLYETDNPAHPIIGVHTKKTSVFDAGFETNNNVEITVPLQYFIYSGLFTITKECGTFVSDDLYKYAEFTDQDGSDKLLSTNPARREYFGYKEESFLSSFATSKIKDDTQDLEATFYVKDRTNDSKYYRQSKTDLYPANTKFENFGKVKYFVNTEY